MSLSTAQKVIYFVPHQDDELLTMGIAIATSVKKGVEVYVVLCTDGSRSRIRTMLNDGQACDICQSRHCHSLSVVEFIRARDREFFASCAALGVKRENILMEDHRIIDGELTEAKAAELMKKYLAILGTNCAVGTMYPNDATVQHRDHRRLGLAALQLKREGVIKKLTLFEEPYVLKKVVHTPEDEPAVIEAKNDIAEKIENAINEYARFSPSEQRFAIGSHSMMHEMRLLKRDKKQYCHFCE